MPKTKDRHLATTKEGRPPVIAPDTPEVADRIIAAIRGRNHTEAAAASAGIAKATLFDALRHGRRVLDGRLPKGHRKTAKDVYLGKFADRYARAMADAELHTIALIGQAGTVTSTETRRTRKVVGTDKVTGQPIYADEVTTIERPPDVRHLEWIAERRWGAWAPRSRNEHSGPGGGPIPVELQVEGLMAKWAAARAETQPAELEPGVIDVEPVED